MTSPKIVPGQPLSTVSTILTTLPKSRPRLVRRGKYAKAVDLTIDTDLFEPALQEGLEPHGPQTPATPQSATSTASTGSLALTDTPASEVSSLRSESLSPPVSVSYTGDTNDEMAPHFFKIAAWLRDVPLPHGESANVDATAINHETSGARTTRGPKGTTVVLVAHADEMRHTTGLNDLLHFGFTRFATRLQQDAGKNKLSRIRMDGKKVAVRSGTYAFVIDQDGELVTSLAASPKGGAPAGAHLNLVAGLPVLFAGELTIDGGAIVSYTPMSGSYRTPECQRQAAESHPLLRDAQLQAPEGWQI